jgi:hypothetical protein
MLVVYFVDFGVTQMVVPLPLRPYLGELFDLGRSRSNSSHVGNVLIGVQAGCTTHTWR